MPLLRGCKRYPLRYIPCPEEPLKRKPKAGRSEEDLFSCALELLAIVRTRMHRRLPASTGSAMFSSCSLLKPGVDRGV